MKKSFNKINSVKGELSFKGDKSISHRALFFSSMAEGRSVVRNISISDDVNSTKSVFKKLGVDYLQNNQELIVLGRGRNKFKKPNEPLYCGNSGTTARLLAGLLAAQNFESEITGDDSLSKRPMKRVIEPLNLMGANISSNNDKLPLTFRPSENLKNIDYKLTIPSAQVKSSILIAGLHLDENTIVKEEFVTRDHTERMLGLKIELHNDVRIIYSSSDFYPLPQEYFIPGDLSSAAFYIVLTLLSENSELFIKDVSLNPTRTGFLNLLKEMNANIIIENIRTSNNEPYGDLIIKSSNLKNIVIDKSIIPNIIDEIPILAVAGVFAEGEFYIRNCKELRYKESDRIKSICENLRLTGIDVEEYEDGFGFYGTIKNKNIVFKSYDDHRIAMAFSILALLTENCYSVENVECVSVSNPDFYNQLEKISC